ncbi:hypothetical protein E2C01_049481 [Portunus trituberculatus]|uniref:Uncharacterized protein n=1 Tax=Portunus trituberculatus TaxID=210409 RepID=A0A5B7G6H6_PORTR|nr:hypothetical protein [Portunus trituberculatus]
MQENVILMTTAAQITTGGGGRRDTREPLFTTTCVDAQLSDIFSSIKSSFWVQVLKSSSIESPLYTHLPCHREGVAGGSVASGGDGAINGYSSYVITIDGISTVFPNPVRLSGGGGSSSGGHQGEGLQVITGDILSPEVKMTNYDPEEDTKLPPEAHPFSQDKGGRPGPHSMYNVASATKGTSQDQAGRDYGPPDLQQTILLEQQPGTLNATLQDHSLVSKPKVE